MANVGTTLLVPGLIDALGDNYTFAGSVVGVDSASTTLAMFCTDASQPASETRIVDPLCDPQVAATVIYNPSSIDLRQAVTGEPDEAATGNGVGVLMTGSLSITCKVTGSTAAACYGALAYSTSTQTDTTTLTSPLPTRTVRITAGAEKLSASGGTITQSTSGGQSTNAVSTTSSGTAKPTGAGSRLRPFGSGMVSERVVGGLLVCCVSIVAGLTFLL